MKFRFLLGMVILLALGLLVTDALAMNSTNYRLDWFVPLSGGGGSASSANYAVNFTVGQSATGAASSANYRIGWGYWYGLLETVRLVLPLIMR